MLPDPPPSSPIFAPLSLADLLASLEATLLVLLEDEVKSVYTTLDEQITVLQGLTFTGDGAVPTGAYGRGHESGVLAYEHGRAHGVIVDSLVEMRADLGAFQEAILAAKAVIGETDEQVQADLQAALLRTQGLDLGASTDNDDKGVSY